MRELLAGRSGHVWRRACARGTAWLADIERDSGWAVASDPLGAIGLSPSPFGTVLADVSALAIMPAAETAAAPEPAARNAVAGDASRRHTPRTARKTQTDRASAPANGAARAEYVARPARTHAHRAGDVSPAAAPQRARPPSAAVRTVSRARLVALAGDAARVPSLILADERWGGRASTSAADAISLATAARRGVVALVPADAGAARSALAQRLVRRAARTLANGFSPRGGTRFSADASLGDVASSTSPASRATFAARARRKAGVADMVAGAAATLARAAETIAAGWNGPIEPGEVAFEPAASSAAAASQSSLAPSSPASSPASPRAAKTFSPPAPAPEPFAPAAAYPPRDVLAPTARRNVGAETDAARIDAPVVATPFAALTPLRARRGFPLPVASPLSVAESVAEERPAFDPVAFAEQVRAALVNDARRHGIDV